MSKNDYHYYEKKKFFRGQQVFPGKSETHTLVHLLAFDALPHIFPIPFHSEIPVSLVS